jgi:hypothetical protein
MGKQGTMLWFNELKDVGALRTPTGERLDVPGTAFATGHKPIGRCAGKAIEFVAAGEAVTSVAFVDEPAAGRARRRRRT